MATWIFFLVLFFAMTVWMGVAMTDGVQSRVGKIATVVGSVIVAAALVIVAVVENGGG